MNGVTCDVIAEISQTIIAVLIVIGGGLVLFTNGTHSTDVLGLMGIVIGYYFGRQWTMARVKPPPAQEDKGNAPT